MANYKVRLHQVYKDGSALDILYPETKSSCVIAELGETSVNPYNDNEMLTKSNNLDVKLGIVNKYLTNLKKYTFNDLGTDVESDSSEVKPASMKALSLVNDKVDTNSTDISNIINFIGKDVAGTSTDERAVVINSTGNAFVFKDMSSLTVGNATNASTAGTANYAKDVASGSTLATTLSGIQSKATRIDNEQQQKILETTFTIEDGYLVITTKKGKSGFSTDSSKITTSKQKVDLSSLIVSVMNGLQYTPTDVLIGTCGICGLTYFSDDRGPGRYASSTVLGNDTSEHTKAVTSCLTKIYGACNNYTCTISFKTDVASHDLGNHYPYSHIFVLLAKNNRVNSSTYAYAVGTGATVPSDRIADRDCKLIFSGRYDGGWDSISGATITGPTKEDNMYRLKCTFTVPDLYEDGSYLLIGASGAVGSNRIGCAISFEDIKITLTR